VRALLIVNPHATSTTPVRRDVIARALASELDLEVAQTRYRDHAADMARTAAHDGFELILTLGGDGTVNEVVNGLLRAQPPGADHQPSAAERPALAALPGGSANVFTRALGMPADPVDATGRILASLLAHRERAIGLGFADGRYFTSNAGLGIDAEVVRAVEGQRADGQAASAARYVWTATRHFFTVTDRRHPALTLSRDGFPEVGGLYCGIVSNTAPWTYVGSRAVNPSPQAAFEAGLDLFALRSLGTLRTLNALRQMLNAAGQPPGGRHVLSLHDQFAFTVRAARPIAFQVDGEYVGEREEVSFRAVPQALRVIT
jgi:diacylglycerol kinase family enzyme